MISKNPKAFQQDGVWWVSFTTWGPYDSETDTDLVLGGIEYWDSIPNGTVLRTPATRVQFTLCSELSADGVKTALCSPVKWLMYDGADTSIVDIIMDGEKVTAYTNSDMGHCIVMHNIKHQLGIDVLTSKRQNPDYRISDISSQIVSTD